MQNKSTLLLAFTIFVWLTVPSEIFGQDVGDSDEQQEQEEITSGSQNWEFGADFMVGNPQGEFQQNLDDMGFGVDLLAVYHLSAVPVALGLDVGFLTYGTTRRDEPFNPNIPEVTIQVRTSNNIAFFHFLTRIQPTSGVVQPYIDGLIGVNYLFTESKVTDDSGQDEIASTTNFSDAAFSGGVGAGVKFQLFDTIEPESQQRMRISLNFRARYILGGEAEYLQRGSILVDEQGNMTFDSDFSKTDLLTFHLGFTIRI